MYKVIEKKEKEHEDQGKKKSEKNWSKAASIDNSQKKH